MNDGGRLGPESWVDGVSDGRDQGWPAALQGCDERSIFSSNKLWWDCPRRFLVFWYGRDWDRPSDALIVKQHVAAELFGPEPASIREEAVVAAKKEETGGAYLQRGWSTARTYSNTSIVCIQSLECIRLIPCMYVHRLQDAVSICT